MTQLLEQIPVAPALQVVIGLSAIILGTLIAGWLARFVLSVVAGKLTGRTKTDLDDHLVAASRKYLVLIVYLFGLMVMFDYLQTVTGDYVGAGTFTIIDAILFGIGVAFVALLLVRIVSTIVAWYGRTIAVRTKSSIDDEIMPLVERTTKIIIYALALLIILEHFDVDVKGLIAVLGIGSLAIALAAQDTIANMIGGFVIMIDRPFREGDRIRHSDGSLCIVEKIGIRSTKLLTFDNTLIITPNAELMKSTIHNETYPRPEVRLVVNVGVGYNSDLDHVKRVMLDEAVKHPQVLKEPEPYFAFLDFGDSSLDVSVRGRVASIKDRFMAGCELREQILKRFRTEGIEIPFPQRVITMVSENREEA